MTEKNEVPRRLLDELQLGLDALDEVILERDHQIERLKQQLLELSLSNDPTPLSQRRVPDIVIHDRDRRDAA